MNHRILVLPLLVAGAFLFFTTEEAQASPLSATSGHTAIAFGPRIRVGVGVAVPIGHRHYRSHRRVYAPRPQYREVVEYVGGYYETHTDRVKVQGEQIGWDMHGQPLYGPERYELREHRVWVPRRRIVRRVLVRSRAHVVHRRPAGYVTVGGSVRVR